MQKQILYFTAPWCAPCQSIKPMIAELQETLNLETVDIDDVSSSEMVAKYNIMSIPAFIFLEDGKIKKQHIGTATKEKIIEMSNIQ